MGAKEIFGLLLRNSLKSGSGILNSRPSSSCRCMSSLQRWTSCLPTRYEKRKSDRLLFKRGYGSSIHEPTYLDAIVVEVPVYDVLNIQLKGYDFPVLEKYGRYVHHTAERFGITVDEAWPQPCQKLRITKLKPESTAIASEYPLNLYERNVQMSDVPATLLPVLINVVEATLPAGVTLRVHPHLQEHTENRYVPDLELIKLRSDLDEMRGDKEKKAP